MADHSTYTGANLHRPFHYEQDTDPGSVTVGQWWADTANRRIRRRTSTGWIAYGGTSGGGTVDTYTAVPAGTNWAGLLTIVAAANPGDTIVLADETIVQTSTLIIEKNLTILGNPGGFSKIQLTSDVTYLGSAVQIHIAHWSGGPISLGLHNFTVEQVRPGVYRSTVITLANNCDGIEISGCTFLGITSNVVNMQSYYSGVTGNPDSATFRNIYFHHNTVIEWWESVVIIAAGQLDGLWVYNNYCTTTNGPPGWSPPYGVALDVEDSYGIIKNVSIDGNHFEFAYNGSGGFSFSLGFVQSVSFQRGPVSYQNIAVTNNNFIGFDIGISIRAVNTMADTPASITLQSNFVQNSLTATSTAAIRLWPSDENGGGGTPKGSPLDYLAFLNNTVASFNEFAIQIHPDYYTYSPNLYYIDHQNSFIEPITAVDLNSNLAAFWSLEEASGTRAAATGTDNLTSVNTVGQAAGVITGTFAAQFNSASSRYLVSAASPAVSTGVTFTFCCWVYFDTTADCQIAGQGDWNNTTYAWSLRISSGVFRFEVDANGHAETADTHHVDHPTVPVTGRWYCVFAWMDRAANTISIRVNNIIPPGTEPNKMDQARVNATHATNMFTSTAPFIIGAHLISGTTPSEFMNGRIDQAAFYDRRMTQLEMDAFYNGGGGLTYAQLSAPINAIKHKLSSFWSLEEASGNRADAHGSNTLTDVNTVTQSAGIVGNCAHFTHASSEKLTVASTANLQPGMDGFSISAWFYLDSLPAAGDTWVIAAKFGAVVADYQWVLWVFRTYDGLFYTGAGIYDGAGGGWSSDNNFPPLLVNTWHHAVAIYNPADKKMYLYIDTNRSVSKTLTAGLNMTGTGPFYLGDLFDGRIDQVGYWQRQLRPDEITWLYNSGAGRSYAAMP